MSCHIYDILLTFSDGAASDAIVRQKNRPRVCAIAASDAIVRQKNRPRVCVTSLALPIRSALFQEGLHPFFLVLGGKAKSKGLCFVAGAAVDAGLEAFVDG